MWRNRPLLKRHSNTNSEIVQPLNSFSSMSNLKENLSALVFIVQPVTVTVDKAVLGHPVFAVTFNCNTDIMYQTRHRFRVFKAFNQVFKQLLPNIVTQATFPISIITKHQFMKNSSDYLEERRSSLETVSFFNLF